MTTSTGAVSKSAVIIKQLRADHGQQGFKNFRPLNPEMVKEVERNVRDIFDAMGGPSLLKSSRDVYHVRPDVTLIEGVEGTIYGHYPPLSQVDRCVRPFRVLIGGLNVVAVDIVGARIFGKRIEDVPHLKLALEKGLGDGIESERDITGQGG